MGHLDVNNLTKLTHHLLLAALLQCAIPIPAPAYEVWLGLLCTPANAAKLPGTWRQSALHVEGLNCNFPPCKPTPGTPSENETACTHKDLLTVVKQFAAKNNCIIEIPRSACGPKGRHAARTLQEALDEEFSRAKKYGFEIKTIMFYDNAIESESYNWNLEEVKAMRKLLDADGHQDVELMYNARNSSKAVRDWCSNPLVDAVMLEANPYMWPENKGNRQELLKWLWTSPQTKAKKLYFQIPISKDPFGEVNHYMSVRRLMVWFGTELMDFEFMRSPRVIFMPVTYNGPTMTFYPETVAPDQYANTMTGIALSLIEQRDLFEGRTKTPTQADADSFVRKP